MKRTLFVHKYLGLHQNSRSLLNKRKYLLYTPYFNTLNIYSSRVRALWLWLHAIDRLNCRLECVYLSNTTIWW